MLVPKITNPTILVTNNAGIGIPRLLVRAKMEGASPLTPKEKSILVEAYIPELAEESTDVRITAFIILAAPAKPARLKTKVNGLIVISEALVPNKF